MNLHRVEYINIDDPNYYSGCYDQYNCTWWVIRNNLKFYGITINYKHCIEYVDGIMFINLDKLEIVKKKLNEYDEKKQYIIFIVFDSHMAIFLGDEEYINEYHIGKFTIKLTQEEYIIKKLLE